VLALVITGHLAGCVTSGHLRTETPPATHIALEGQPTLFVALDHPNQLESRRWQAFQRRERELLEQAGVTVVDERDVSRMSRSEGDLVLRLDLGQTSATTEQNGCMGPALGLGFFTAWLSMLGCVGSDDTHYEDTSVQLRLFDAFGTSLRNESDDDELVTTIDTRDRSALLRDTFDLDLAWASPTLGNAPSQGPQLVDLDTQIGERMAEIFVEHLLPDLARAQAFAARRRTTPEAVDLRTVSADEMTFTGST
jgi:hypothetical protein